MKLKDFLDRLSRYNLEADVKVVVGSESKEFEICYGSSEGCTPENCDSIDLFVDPICERSE